MHLTPTVYVVDDDEGVRESLSWLLGGVPLPVITFDSAEAFLEAYTSDFCGCILLDLVMPGMSGLELLRQHVPGLIQNPIILLTGHADVPVAVQAMQMGARDILEKPYRAEVLLQKVTQALAEEEANWPLRHEASVLRQALATLTPREHEVLRELAVGRSNRDVGTSLEISPRTVEIHRARILEKTASDSVTDLVYRLMKAGISVG